MGQSRTPLKWIIIISIFFGVVDGFINTNNAIANISLFVQAISTASLIFIWCDLHSRENLNKPVGNYRLLSALIPIVGVPVYFFRFYGFGDGLQKSINAFIFMFLAGISYSLPFVLISYYISPII